MPLCRGKELLVPRASGSSPSAKGGLTALPSAFADTAAPDTIFKLSQHEVDAQACTLAPMLAAMNRVMCCQTCMDALALHAVHCT